MEADKFACDFTNKQSLVPDGVDTQQTRTKLFKANMFFQWRSGPESFAGLHVHDHGLEWHSLGGLAW